MSFEAWHGSRYGACSFGSNPAWFSLLEGEAYSFAMEASRENYLPTLCRVSVEGSRYDLFDASDLDDDEFRELFVKCLKSKGVSDYWIPHIIGSMLNYEFTAFDPDGGGTDSHKVSECIQEMGFIGWLERESHRDEPLNFGLFNPGDRVTVIEVLKLDPDKGMQMEKIDDFTYDDGETIYKICEECGQLLEFDEEDDEWTYSCHCDFRKNPSRDLHKQIP